MGDFAAAMATDNITMKAIKEYFRKRSGKRPDQIFPFTSENKYSGASFDEGTVCAGSAGIYSEKSVPGVCARN